MGIVAIDGFDERGIDPLAAAAKQGLVGDLTHAAEHDLRTTGGHQAICQNLTRLGLGEIHGFLLDGYPRTPDQAAALEGFLAEAGTPMDAAVNLDVPVDEVMARMVA
ncbi:MAG: nucleoside monophosphate kinase, partial [Phycisphaerales bacterium]|nr:nucleoside monophosphate kinase [Phycisphaerales bacterium]